MKVLLKRTLPLLLALVLVIGIALTVTLLTVSKKNPKISNEDAAYMTVQDGEQTYTITNAKMYELLKGNSAAALSNLVDAKILGTVKNSEGKTYLEAVTDAQIATHKDEAIYGDAEAKAALTEEEKAEKLEDYKESLKLNGYTEETVLASYRLVLAREQYAKDQYAKETEETKAKYEAAEVEYNRLKDEKEALDDEMDALEEELETAVDNDASKKEQKAIQKKIDAKQEEIDAKQTAMNEQNTIMTENSYVASDDKVKTYYTTNYHDAYYAIIVKYANQTAFNNALAQLGVGTTSTTESLAQLVWTAGEEHKNASGEYRNLTNEEVIKVYAALYNNANAYKLADYPTNKIIISDTTNFYNVEDGKYVSNVANVNLDSYIKYTYEELGNISTTVRSKVISMTTFGSSNVPTDSEPVKNKSFVRNGYSDGTSYYAILKLDVEKTAELVDENDAITNATLKQEIVDILLEEGFNEDYEAKEILSLRREYSLVIYDSEIEEKYVANDTEFEKTKKADSKNVASIKINDEVVYFTADELYKELSDRYGMGSAVELVNYERLLSNKELNKIYNYTSSDPKASNKKDILDKDEWQALRDQIESLNNAFISGNYAYYGFAADYGWEKFIHDFFLNYGVSIDDEKDLRVFYMYQSILADYQEAADVFKELEDKVVTTDNEDNVTVKDDKGLVDTDLSTKATALWKKIKPQMQEELDEFFSVTGMHLLITVNDEEGNPVDPSKWTAHQKTLAEKLYKEVLVYLESKADDKQATALSELVTAYNNAPYLVASSDSSLASQPKLDGKLVPFADDVDSLKESAYVYDLKNSSYIELSVYKSAGLSIKYESLGTFGPGKMVENFENAAKKLWQDNYEVDPTGAIVANGNHIYYGSDDKNNPDYLVTEFGYHVYVQTAYTANTSVVVSENNATKGEVKGNTLYLALPTLQNIVTYVTNSTDDAAKELTEWEILCVTSLYSPIQTEIVGSYNAGIRLLNEQKGLTITFGNSSYTAEQYFAILDSYIDYYQEQLTYEIN